MSNEPKTPGAEETTATTLNAPVETTPTEPVAPVEAAGSEEPADDEDDSALLAMRDDIQKTIDEKGNQNRTYTQKDMDEMAQRLALKFSKQGGDEEDYVDLLDPNAVKRKFIRVARLNNKFIVDLKNMNTDKYNDQPIYITNIPNPQKTTEMIPWATFIYDDGTEELYPYLSFMKRATGVWAEVLDTDKKDISEKFGTVDMKEIDDKEWNMSSTGKRVLAKAMKYKVTYIVKDIKFGKDLRVSQEVTNKADAPYPELEQFIQATKK